ncbi:MULTISPECIES: anti-sigma factor domain-containing protein [Gammaproteobacteria]|uniref:anti-sigma factor n=1 Tax=Gammaproteobacteria TaxID=1236 RepID=UPI000DCFF2F8|nr:MULTISPECIES: anti-sigma factor [Gammaproteobacteria]RTE86590.1 hypothetical protein DQX04_08530 [Aliidiomarina sp. B3213]TCZ90855.1 hypothetical protein EYQ95_08515 [Lysobacter sp. N42]
MNYHNLELTDQLARRYVIGLMRGQARVKFVSLMQRDSKISQQVVYWEGQLHDLTERLQPVSPPKKSWNNIHGRLFSNVKKKFDLWHWLGAFGSVAAIVLTVLLIGQTNHIVDEPNQKFAVIQNDDKQTLWVLNVSNNSIEVSPQPSIEGYSDKDYELWMLPKDGSNPISLGLLPESEDRIVLTAPPGFSLAEIGGLAVSLEPAGGSTTGLPSGPVLYLTDIVQI